MAFFLPHVFVRSTAAMARDYGLPRMLSRTKRFFKRLFPDLAGNSPRIEDPDRRVTGVIPV
nr:hypothetical protein [Corynebacterium diphtheriae]